MGKKLQKTYPTNYNLLILQDLWQGHYEILLIVLLKELIKLNANMGVIKKAKRGTNRKILIAVLNTQPFKISY